jgi:DNA modification methylase
MLDDMGASYIDNNGNPVPYEERNNKPQVYIPGVGAIYTHGLKDEYAKWCLKNNKTNANGNNHPTVKPIELMKYLIRLVTPAGGRVLDPFNGSGSTGCAAVELDYDYTGIELDAKYVEIAEKRIAAWYAATHNSNFDQVFEIL